MKKILFMLSLMLAVGWTSAFANNDPKLNPRVEAAFKKEFPAAQHVEWIKGQENFKAVFVLADYRVEAWFSADGELLSTARDLLYNQLPLAVMKEVENRFPASKASEVKEITDSRGTLYQLLLETEKRNYRISATPNGEITVTERIRK